MEKKDLEKKVAEAVKEYRDNNRIEITDTYDIDPLTEFIEEFGVKRTAEVLETFIEHNSMFMLENPEFIHRESSDELYLMNRLLKTFRSIKAVPYEKVYDDEAICEAAEPEADYGKKC